MRCVEKGAAPAAGDGTVIELRPYQQAAPHLKDRIGRYCSFCERFVPVNLAVEHKLPKVNHPHLECEWTNFLLACTNCNSCKGTNEAPAGESLWPDVDDTFSAFDYMESGRIRVRPGLPADVTRRATAMLTLLGLDKTPVQISSADHRWDDRLEIWRQAEQSRQDLAENDTEAMRRSIILTAINKGGFSIWMAAFSTDAAMQLALCSAFTGTTVRHR
jgi:uncharacterized protein (TIGR02646 family)